MDKIGKAKLRRTYYIGALFFIVSVTSLLCIPIYLNIQREYRRKLDQLEQGILYQKQNQIRSTVLQTISTISELEKILRLYGTYGNEDDFDRMFRSAVKELIHNTELPRNGYIWINEILNYSGGENYAIRFVHPNLRETEGEYLSTDTIDNNGNFPYLEELNGINAFGETYNTYFFRKVDSDIVAKKMSYGKLYKPYNWVVSTGVYLDDVDALVKSESIRMVQTNRKTISQIARTILVSFLILTLLVTLFEMRINKVISAYITTLKDSNDQLRVAFNRIKEMAYTDHLTMLYNRRAMYDYLEDEKARFLRTGKPFSILLGDIDFFKSVNDSYGHDAGDLVIKEVARILQQNIRKEDKASRWGGEEFLCLITNSDSRDALTAAEKIRSAIESSVFIYEEHSLSVTMTIGVASSQPDWNIDELIDRADKNLYRGKKEGRNRVMGD